MKNRWRFLCVLLCLVFVFISACAAGTGELKEENLRKESFLDDIPEETKILPPDQQQSPKKETELKKETNEDISAQKTKENERNPSTEGPKSQENFKEEKQESGEKKTAPEEDKTQPAPQKTCIISIRCDTILSNLSKLDEAKREILPPDGIMLSEKEVTFEEGQSAFDVLLKVTKAEKIPMEFSKTPGLNSNYIEGIGNIYEFDCGELSGWLYKVNGNIQSVGCSSYLLSDGDQIEFLYTCDLGKDVGSEF